MSNELNHYAKDLDTIARDFISTVEVAENKVKEAEKDVLRAKNEADRMTAKAELMRQQDALRLIKRDLPEQTMQHVKELRNALAADLNRAFAVNPDEVDNNAMKMLERANMMMYDRYAAEGNITMCRIVADAAGLAAEKLDRKDPNFSILRNVELAARSFSGIDYLHKFDVITDVLRRTTRNHALFSRWDKLTAEMIEQF